MADETCPTCDGPCEKVEHGKSDDPNCGYCGTANDPEAVCDTCWDLLQKHEKIPRYYSTAEADARRAAREAAIAMMQKIIEITHNANKEAVDGYRKLGRWIDEKYPPDQEVK